MYFQTNIIIIINNFSRYFVQSFVGPNMPILYIL